MPESLFAPVTINRLVLPNRFVRSATHEGLCGEDGLYTPALTEKLAELARGGIGLIISGHAFVSPGGRAGRNQAAAGRDECVVPWEHALEQIHAAGGRIALQLAHAGGLAADAETAAGPSPFAAGTKRPPCRELTLSSIAELVDLFTSAAVRAHEAGFDAVEIHAAHGYLLSQFLSPVYNKRTDRYGGELANRARLLYEIVSSIRNAVGGDFPILVKINSDDFADGGFTAAECGSVCEELQERGVDAIELSGGIPASRPGFGSLRNAGEPPYYREIARKIRNRIDIPVILVGGFTRFETCNAALHDGCADLIALSRPLIREPGLIERWRSGDLRPAACVRCNGCFRPILVGRGFRCPVATR